MQTHCYNITLKSPQQNDLAVTLNYYYYYRLYNDHNNNNFFLVTTRRRKIDIEV